MNCPKVCSQIESQLKEFIGDKIAIVGISGGIDSSVVATLCNRALGTNKGFPNTWGIMLPYGEQSTELSVKLANWLDIINYVLDITEAVSAFTSYSDRDKIVVGNIMARVRMIYLYREANTFNGIVVGTTNKTEAMIGYYTKYGDGGVDVEPIADLFKTEVYELARYLGIPQEIIDAKPSAGLWEGQTDEDELGITYEKLDALLSGEVPNPIYSLTNKERELVNNLMRAAKHKQEMPPVFKVKK